MKRVLLILTVLLLIAGTVSLTINDKMFLRDLRATGSEVWTQIDEAGEHLRSKEEAWAGANPVSLSNGTELFGSFQRIRYEGTNTELRFETHDNEGFYEVYHEVSGGAGELLIDESNNELRIKEEPENSLSGTDYTVTIRIPEDFHGEIRVDVVNGSIYGENMKNPMTLDTVNGDITLGMTAAVPVKIKNVNGTITVGYDADSMQDLRYDFDFTNGVVSILGEEHLALGGSNELQGRFGKGTVDLKIETVNGMITLNQD